MTDTVLEVVGFDLGHGETSFSVAAVDRDAPPEMLSIHGEKSQITAIARHPVHGVLVGEKALKVKGCTSFEICFKRRPDGDPLFEQNVRDFASTCYEHLVSTRQICGKNETQMYVGCPSGWSEQDRENYQVLLASTGIPLLTVVSESRAAVLHARDSGKVTPNELKGSVLVVDIGSSTTDFTLVEYGRENPVDFGADLGAALIDQALAEHVLSHSPDGEALRAVIAAHPVFRGRCLIACRKAKEEYFRHPELYDAADGESVEVFERIQSVGVFELNLSGALMQEILARPLEALGGKSWGQRFEQLLEDALKQCETQGKRPSAVIMTGGASRMQFTQAACERVFGAERQRLDTEPEYCIARGLARWGRVDNRTTRFLEQVHEFCERVVPEVVLKRRASLPAALAGPLTQALLEHAVRTGLRDWRAGRVKTLDDLEQHLRELATKWLDSVAGRALIAQSLAVWFEPVQTELAGRADRIAMEYHLPAGTLAPRVEFQTDLPELPSVDNVTALEKLGDVGAVLVACVVAALLGGGGVALLLTGPLGLLVGFVVGLLPGKFVRQMVQDQVRKSDLPIFVRKAMMSDERIAEASARTATDLETAVRDKIASAEAQFTALLSSVVGQLKVDLEQRAEEQRAWIR